jgi:Dyp-type peroxidase family
MCEIAENQDGARRAIDVGVAPRGGAARAVSPVQNIVSKWRQRMVRPVANLRYTLDLDRIQGGIVPGFKKDHQGFLLFTIGDLDGVKIWLNEIRQSFVSAKTVADAQAVRREVRRRNQPAPTSQDIWLNIAFSNRGLQKLRPDWEPSADDAFARAPSHVVTLEEFPAGLDPSLTKGGMFGDTAATTPDVFLIVGADHADTLAADLDQRVQRLAPLIERTLYRLEGATLGGAKEHFGYRDGISQPSPDDTLLDGWLREIPGDGGAPQVVAPGEIIRGYADELDPTQLQPDPTLRPWEANGSYLVFLRLEQLVGSLRATFKEQAELVQMSEEEFAAKMLGRWRTGARLRPGPVPAGPPEWDPSEAPIPASAYEADREGRTVPLFAHIRKANPRLLDPPNLAAGEPDIGLEADDTPDPRRHRLVRRSVPYGEPLPPGDMSNNDFKRGILFCCYQSNIERQFERVMEDWLAGPEFSPVAGSPAQGPDPIAAGILRLNNSVPLKLPDPAGGQPEPVTLKRFILPRAGGYFFAPSLPTIDAIINGTAPPASVATGDIVEEAIP